MIEVENFHCNLSKSNQWRQWSTVNAIMNISSDSSFVSHATVTSPIYIGNTEPSSVDFELLSREIDRLKMEKIRLENKTDQLYQETLIVKLENAEIKRKHRELENFLESERNQHETELQNMQHQMDENSNYSWDMEHKYRLQLEQREETIRSLSKELVVIKSRLLNYENGNTMEIRPRQPRRFKSSVLTECRRCHSVIEENDTKYCCFHPEKPIRTPLCSAGKQMMFWKCCYQVSRLEPPGCTSFDNHDPAT